MTEQNKLDLDVRGMSCPSCGHHVETALTKVEGVETKPLLQRIWQITGYDQFDNLLKDIAKSIKGYRVRNEVAQTITDEKGKKSVTKIVQHIKSIRKIDKHSEDTFKIPSCTKISSDEMEERAEHFIFLLAGKLL